MLRKKKRQEGRASTGSGAAVPRPLLCCPLFACCFVLFFIVISIARHMSVMAILHLLWPRSDRPSLCVVIGGQLQQLMMCMCTDGSAYILFIIWGVFPLGHCCVRAHTLRARDTYTFPCFKSNSALFCALHLYRFSSPSHFRAGVGLPH